MTFSEFISMGGYGFYIWMSFGMTALLIAAELLYLRHQHKNTIRRLQRLARINSESK